MRLQHQFRKAQKRDDAMRSLTLRCLIKKNHSKSESLSKHGQLFQVRHKNMNDSLGFLGGKTVHVIQQNFIAFF
jgi:hypothetical protein